MTEDDTFLALRRPGVAEMLRNYEDWTTNKNCRYESLDAMCERHGWTWLEFSVVGAIYRDSLK